MDRGKGALLFFRILSLIFLVIFIISIIRYSFGGSTISFASFLDYASNTPQISVEYSKVAHVVSDWPSWALWLRAIIVVIAEIINVLWWIMRNVANLLLVVTYYVGFLFV